MVKYFMYSSQQLEFLKNMEAKLGKKFRPGAVIVNGTRKPFTEMASVPNFKYTDTKIVAQGDVDFMTFTLPTSV